MAVRELKYPFKAKRGVENRFMFRMLEADAVTPISLEDAEFRTDLRYTVNDTTVIKTLTNTDGFEITEDGEVEMILSKDTLSLIDMSKGNITAQIPFINIVFDIEYRNGDDAWKPFVMGVIRVVEQVTRSNDE